LGEKWTNELINFSTNQLNDMMIQKATEQHRGAIVSLLQSQKLPAEDLPPALDDFLIVKEEDSLVGLIGLERYGDYGLLRSMVVHPAYRNRQIAERLVQQLETNASGSGITVLYLLTETAAAYFNRKGYQTIHRNEVPPRVMASTEFSHVCPASATVMKKELQVMSNQ
jgi:amino-acid N-acetyltransferase